MPIDVHSATWEDIKAKAEKRFESAHARLKSPMTDHPDTMLVRGQIEILEWLLALPEPKRGRTEITGDGPGYHKV